MRHQRLLLHRRPRRQHAEITVDLHGISADHHAIGLLRQRERQRRLAAGGRPCDKHGLVDRLGAGHSRSHTMSLVATLICNPNNPALNSTILEGARAVLPSAGPAHWLWDEVAADIPFDAPTKDKDDIRAISERLRAARGDLPIDIVVQPIATRRKKLFLADIDFDHDRPGMHRRTGRLRRLEGSRRQNHRAGHARRDRVRAGVARAGFALPDLEQRRRQGDGKRITPTPGGRALFVTMRAHGAYTVWFPAVSRCSPTQWPPRIGFQENCANDLVIMAASSTGGVAEPILGRATKARDADRA